MCRVQSSGIDIAEGLLESGRGFQQHARVETVMTLDSVLLRVSVELWRLHDKKRTLTDASVSPCWIPC